MTSLEALEQRFAELDLKAVRPRKQGVYLLVADGEIIYVGQTTVLESRVVIHRTVTKCRPQDTKRFDRVLWLDLSDDDLDDYEGALIRALRPRFCKRAPAHAGHDNDVLGALGLPLHDDEPKVVERWLARCRAQLKAQRLLADYESAQAELEEFEEMA